MLLDEEIGNISPDRDTVLTVGVFDGVHRGHRHLLNRVIDAAKKTNRACGVVTFKNHPASLLRPDFKLRYLITLDERLRRIRELGLDFVAPITFDNDLSRLSVRDFVTKLQRQLRMRWLIVGPDFAMGRNRKGDSRALATLGKEMGFSLDVVDLLVTNGHAIKSTAIRNALWRGDINTVTAMLGRKFTVRGTVVTGMKRGRTLGFPTANLDVPPHMAIPADGVYATWANVDGKRHMAATSIGVRPTFDEGWRTIEAFLLDFDGDLYGKELTLEFVERQRDELKFDTVELLLDQMSKDVDDAKAILTADACVNS